MVSRSELISRILSEQGNEPSSFKNNRTWDNQREFIKDNLREVDEKLQIIDNCIWGKVVVMERGTRIAKAYLRSGTVNIDGSCHEFDGSKLGLGAFTYLSRNIRTFHLLSKLGKGIDLYMDFLGNVSLSNRTGRKILVESQGNKYDIGIYKEKIFDLRQFRQSLNESRSYGQENVKEKAIMWIQIVSGGFPMESPLWLCLIHVIAVEMVSLLNPRPSSSSLTSSSSSPDESQSIPRWTAPRPPLSQENNHYEECSKEDSVKDREESLYSMPEIVAPGIVRDHLNSSPSTSSTNSSSFSNPATENTRLSRFTQHEREIVVKKRGGVRKRLEKSLGPPLERSRSLTNLSFSIIDLRTLANMKRPVYFQKAVTSRTGSRHFFI